jgi:CTP-dependent riboflavin kinase
MRIDIDTVLLSTILKSKTLSKILAKILDAQAYLQMADKTKNVDGISFSMEDLRKSLRYKNKSTVSRGIKALADFNLFELKTTNQGTVINFNPKEIRRV